MAEGGSSWPKFFASGLALNTPISIKTHLKFGLVRSPHQKRIDQHIDFELFRARFSEIQILTINDLSKKKNIFQILTKPSSRTIDFFPRHNIANYYLCQIVY